MVSLEAKKIPFYITIFILILIITTFGNKLKEIFYIQDQEDEYTLIRKYLLNDDIINGNNN